MTERVPQRVRLSRAKGARLGRGVENVARPTRWGNPFTVGDDIQVSGEQRGDVGVYSPDRLVFALSGLTMTADIAVALYEVCWEGLLEAEDDHARAIIAAARKQLRGKDLACWCPLDAPCHADVLLRIVNA